MTKSEKFQERKRQQRARRAAAAAKPAPTGAGTTYRLPAGYRDEPYLARLARLFGSGRAPRRPDGSQ